MFRNICLGDKTSSNNLFAFLYKVKTVISLGVREGNRRGASGTSVIIMNMSNEKNGTT